MVKRFATGRGSEVAQEGRRMRGRCRRRRSVRPCTKEATIRTTSRGSLPVAEEKRTTSVDRLARPSEEGSCSGTQTATSLLQ